MMKWFSYFIVLLNMENIKEVAANCVNETYGLYCTNLMANNKSETLVIDLVIEKSTNVTSIFMRNSSGTIGEATFSEIPQIDSLDIQFCRVKNFSADMKSLQTLYIINNLEFPNINGTLMKHFPGLRTLYISNNHQLKIQNSSFKNMQNLHQLTINGQEITNLSIDYLEGLSELTYLNMQGNCIQHIDGNAFKNMKRLNHLILNDNKIRQFEADTFNTLSNLESLDLIGIDLMILDPTLFKNQEELKYIGVPSGIVTKNFQLKQLTNAFKKLESIGISYNDQNNTNISGFVELCKISGFEIKLVKYSN